MHTLTLKLKPNPFPHYPYNILQPNPYPNNKVGEITAYMRGEIKADASEARVVRKRKAQERYVQANKFALSLTLGLTLSLTHIVNHRYDNNVRKKAKHAAKRDHAEEILGTSLVTSIAELETQLQARCTSSSARTSFLRDRFNARVSGETPRLYPGIGPEFRSKFGKLKLTPSDGTTNKESNLVALVKAMIEEDGDLLANDHYMPKFTEHYIRVLPSLTIDYTNPVASELQNEFAKHIADIAAPEDDPVFVDLHGKYIGKILYDFETRANAKLFRVTAIQFVRSFTSARHSCWEAIPCTDQSPGT